MLTLQDEGLESETQKTKEFHVCLMRNQIRTHKHAHTLTHNCGSMHDHTCILSLSTDSPSLISVQFGVICMLSSHLTLDASTVYTCTADT